MYSEDELLPLSALQHLAFCERQCALIHLEGIWEENHLTAEGRLMHEHVHEADSESRGNLRIARGLQLRSLQLGVAGIADMVEFQRTGGIGREVCNNDAVALPGISGLWRPLPVEYKHGLPKRNGCDEVQLCAQAVCLEEMLDTNIIEGALFYGRNRKRQSVSFTFGLRKETATLATRLHELIASGKTPEAQYEKKCVNCSLLSHCIPGATGIHGRVEHYLWQSSVSRRDDEK